MILNWVTIILTLLGMSRIRGLFTSPSVFSKGKMLVHSVLPISPSAQPQSPIVLLHGLFGSSRNLQSWGKLLQESVQAPVVLLDLRNHGHSPRDSDMTYSSMAEDVMETLLSLDISNCHVIGHSMGGKVAAACAMIMSASPTSALQLKSLTLMDISPVEYSEREASFATLKTTLNELEQITQSWNKYTTKKEIYDNLLFPVFGVRDISLATFMLTNIVRSADDKSWSWLFDLDAIQQNYPHILDFPFNENKKSSVPMLLLKGSKSPFVKTSHMPEIQRRFSSYLLRSVPNAGHWLHIDQARMSAELLVDFLRNVDTNIELEQFKRKETTVPAMLEKRI